MFQTYLKGVARESKEIFIRHFGGSYRVTCFPTAVAAQPIDWTISQTIIGPKGEDLPLRVGQGDEPGSVGFGLSHIKDSPAVSFQPLQRLTQFYITPPTAKAA